VNNRSAPSATVVPILVYPDVGEAIAWLCNAFGFRERLRAARDGVVSHAQLDVGDGTVMLGRQGGPYRAPQGNEVSAYVHVLVDGVDAHFERARVAGAQVVHGPTTMPFGIRQYTARDHAGHWWTFSENVADVAPEAWGATVARQTAAGSLGGG
jgi:uncharacterized glyoxalase superfamily protein PhnB